MEALQSWVSQHKLTSIGAVWASAVGASLAYSRARTPLKPSLRLIHARLHAQALTLAVLSGAAAYHYYEKRVEEQVSSKIKHVQVKRTAPTHSPGYGAIKKIIAEDDDDEEYQCP